MIAQADLMQLRVLTPFGLPFGAVRAVVHEL